MFSNDALTGLIVFINIVFILGTVASIWNICVCMIGCYRRYRDRRICENISVLSISSAETEDVNVDLL